MITTPIPRLFLHFFDTHFLTEVASHVPMATLVEEADLALRIALLAAGEVFLPCASYFESELCRAVLAPWAPVFKLGVVRLTGSSATVGEFTEAKLLQYPDGSRQAALYTGALDGTALIPPYRPRSRSATADLLRHWASQPHQVGFAKRIFGMLKPPAALEDSWTAVPDLLQGRAFTPELVVPELERGQTLPATVRHRVARIINMGYFESFAFDLDAGFVTDMVYLRLDGRRLTPGMDLPFTAIVAELRAAGLLAKIAGATPEQLLEMRGDDAIVRALVTCLGISAPAVQTALYVPRPAELDAQLAAVRATETGRKAASRYQKRVTTLLDMLFEGQLAPGQVEVEINDGRKRIDVVWPNLAREGFFAWASMHWGAQFVYGEAKNYSSEAPKNDPANAELDQLIGRFSAKYRVRFGFMLCRKLTDERLFLRRCGDAFRAEQGLVLPVTDRDLAEMVAAVAARGQQALSGWLYGRYIAVRDG